MKKEEQLTKVAAPAVSARVLSASSEPRKIQKMPMSKSMAIKRSYCGVFMIFGLVTITLYMAFAFPYSLFHLKQTETTEIKSVIIVARNGERSPSTESYFIGEEQPEDLVNFGYDQLTNTGKERMYLLGKYLKLRYYQLLLNGDPRKIYVRSADSDRCLESAQALLAGLNPPKDRWIWSSQNELNNNWQPKAVHSAQAADDDLLSVESECLKLEDKEAWKNSTRYQQLLSEFRHDLQTLRANTGLEFEDDLEMLSNVEDALRTRKAFDQTGGIPSWYTNTLANRLAHISDVTAENRFTSSAVQRLYVGRLLYEIARNVNSKIRLLSLSADSENSANNNHNNINDNDNDNDNNNNNLNNRHKKSNANTKPLDDELPDDDPPLNVYQMQKNKLRANPLTGPNMFIYLTGKNRLTALLNSLQIYSSQLHFGSMLLIELHHDPINQVHFLRLFTISSQNANTFPEPLRVNPKACLDSAECYPQQFEQNIRHIMLDKNAWQEACSVLQDQSIYDSHTFKPQPLWPSAIDEPRPVAPAPAPAPAPSSTLTPPSPSLLPFSPTSTPATSIIDSTTSDNNDKSTSTTTTTTLIDPDSKDLDDTLIVGPLSDKKDNLSSPSSILVEPTPPSPVQLQNSTTTTSTISESQTIQPPSSGTDSFESSAPNDTNTTSDMNQRPSPIETVIVSDQDQNQNQNQNQDQNQNQNRDRDDSLERTTNNSTDQSAYQK